MQFWALTRTATQTAVSRWDFCWDNGLEDLHVRKQINILQPKLGGPLVRLLAVAQCAGTTFLKALRSIS